VSEMNISRPLMTDLLRNRVSALDLEIDALSEGISKGGVRQWSVQSLLTIREAKLGSLYELLHLANYLGVAVQTRVSPPPLQPGYPASLFTEWT
jgi:hypothetical protein